MLDIKIVAGVWDKSGVFLRRPSLHAPHTKLYFILFIQRSVGLVNRLVTQFLNKRGLNLHNFITYLNLI